MDSLALPEPQSQTEGVDAHALLYFGLEIDLHALSLRVEERHVAEPLQLEVGIQMVIDHAQDVAVEVLREALGVVVGRLQHLRALHQIGSQEKGIPRLQGLRHVAQESDSRAALQIPDGAAQEDHQPALAVRNLVQVLDEIPDDSLDPEAGIGRRESLGGALDDLRAHVHRDVAPQRTRALHGIQEHARLVG